MKRFGLQLGLLLLLTIVGLAAQAQQSRPHPPLVVILLPATSLQGWQDANAPHLHNLMLSGALAVMNTRTARLPSDHTRETLESAAMTLGAGARAAGGPEAADFLDPAVPVSGLRVSAVDLYVRRTGQEPPPGRYINLQWPLILRANGRLGYRLRLGALADVLTAKGIRISAGGGHLARCVAAASDGTVFHTETLTARMDQCLIWDAGADLAAADSLIDLAASQTAHLGGRLLILAPSAGDTEYAQGQRLTPVLEWGHGIPAGMLRSPSTHRTGLVVNTDFAPTVASYYDISRDSFPVRPFGEVWTAITAPNAEEKVQALEIQAVSQRQGMQILPYLALSLAAWMLAGTVLAFRKRLPPFWPIMPVVLLVSLVFSVSSLSLLLWFAPILTTSLLLARRLETRKTILLLLTVLAVALTGDMLTGSRLMQRGLLGYSAIEGARYYGIGNEAMGVLIGAMLVLAAHLWRPFGRAGWTLLLLLGFVTLLLGSANAGAKAGGLLVSLAAFGTLGVALLGGRWTVRTAIALAVSTAVVMTIAALGDSIAAHSTHSHMGEAVRRIQAGGWSEAGDIIERKMAVESHLAFHSAWACPLWVGLFCLGFGMAEAAGSYASRESTAYGRFSGSSFVCRIERRRSHCRGILPDFTLV